MSHVCSHDLFIHVDVINVNVIICQITLLSHGYSSRLTCQSIFRRASKYRRCQDRVPLRRHYCLWPNTYGQGHEWTLGSRLT
jgi:hypothetical protein